MSSYVCTLPTQSYFYFKVEYYKRFPSSTYRLGQMFISRFIKKEDNGFDYDKLWNEECVAIAESMIYDLISKLDWDLLSLQPVKKV